MDEQNVGYEEFMEAFDDSVGNQTDAEENTFVEEDPAAEAAADAPAAEDEPDTASDTTEGSEDDSEKPSDKPEETFTLKVTFTIFWSLFKLISIESVMPSNCLILCHPLLLLSSIFPSIWVFSNELALHIRWPQYWSSASASVLPMNI